MIQVLYVHCAERLPDARGAALEERLPEVCRRQIRRFVRWQDRQNRLFSYLLLQEALRRSGRRADELVNITRDNYARPYLRGWFDFSISHSESFTALGVANAGRIGLDLEQLVPLEIQEFRTLFGPLMSQVESAADKLQAFYEMWTKYEAIIKADGRGVSVNPQQIGFETQEIAQLDGHSYFVKRLMLERTVHCHVACEQEQEISVERITPQLFVRTEQRYKRHECAASSL